jgi:intracellular multiplication protein IcmL
MSKTPPVQPENKGVKAPSPQKKANKAAQSSSAASQQRSEELKNSDKTALGSIVTRNDYYRDQYRTLVKIALFEAIAILGLIMSMIVLINVHQPRSYYFATTSDGRQIPMIPLSQPNLSKPALLSWATQAATEVMTFGFNDYRRRLQEASRHFTRQGWLSFTQALQRADIVESVRTNRQAISAAPRSAPVLVSEGLINGRFQWEVRIPLNVTTAFGGGTKSDVWNVHLKIVRVPTLESPNGVGIEQWLAMGG